MNKKRKILESDSIKNLVLKTILITLVLYSIFALLISILDTFVHFSYNGEPDAWLTPFFTQKVWSVCSIIKTTISIIIGFILAKYNQDTISKISHRLISNIIYSVILLIFNIFLKSNDLPLFLTVSILGAIFTNPNSVIGVFLMYFFLHLLSITFIIDIIIIFLIIFFYSYLKISYNNH